MKLSLAILFVLCCFSKARSQNDTLNQTDANGLKQGYWISYGKDFPEKGYPANGKVEEGYYRDSRKNGEWKLYHVDGVTPRLVGNFENNRPQGVYKKYYPSGALKETGCFMNARHCGSFVTYSESGCVLMSYGFNEDGEQHGEVFIYHDGSSDSCGGLKTTFHKKNGVIVGTYLAYDRCGNLTEKREYNLLGYIISSEITYHPCLLDTLDEIARHCPHIISKPFEGNIPSGIKKLYNEKDQLIMEGTVTTDGRVCCGKVYTYDQEGVLERIEIYKGTFPEDLNATSRDYHKQDEHVFSFSQVREIDSADIADPQEWVERSEAPFALGGSTLGPESFDPNGFNHVYTGFFDLWLSGDFKNGYLWNGKQYLRDAEGNETGYEIWKRGKYRRTKK